MVFNIEWMIFEALLLNKEELLDDNMRKEIYIVRKSFLACVDECISERVKAFWKGLDIKTK